MKQLLVLISHLPIHFKTSSPVYRNCTAPGHWWGCFICDRRMLEYSLHSVNHVQKGCHLCVLGVDGCVGQPWDSLAVLVTAMPRAWCPWQQSSIWGTFPLLRTGLGHLCGRCRVQWGRWWWQRAAALGELLCDGALKMDVGEISPCVEENMGNMSPLLFQFVALSVHSFRRVFRCLLWGCWTEQRPCPDTFSFLACLKLSPVPLHLGLAVHVPVDDSFPWHWSHGHAGQGHLWDCRSSWGWGWPVGSHPTLALAGFIP